jgi:hypothetical protein
MFDTKTGKAYLAPTGAFDRLLEVVFAGDV